MASSSIGEAGRAVQQQQWLYPLVERGKVWIYFGHPRDCPSALCYCGKVHQFDGMTMAEVAEKVKVHFQGVHKGQGYPSYSTVHQFLATTFPGEGKTASIKSGMVLPIEQELARQAEEILKVNQFELCEFNVCMKCLCQVGCSCVSKTIHLKGYQKQYRGYVCVATGEQWREIQAYQLAFAKRVDQAFLASTDAKEFGNSARKRASLMQRDGISGQDIAEGQAGAGLVDLCRRRLVAHANSSDGTPLSSRGTVDAFPVSSSSVSSTTTATPDMSPFVTQVDSCTERSIKKGRLDYVLHKEHDEAKSMFGIPTSFDSFKLTYYDSSEIQDLSIGEATVEHEFLRLMYPGASINKLDEAARRESAHLSRELGSSAVDHLLQSAVTQIVLNARTCPRFFAVTIHLQEMFNRSGMSVHAGCINVQSDPDTEEEYIRVIAKMMRIILEKDLTGAELLQPFMEQAMLMTDAKHLDETLVVNTSKCMVLILYGILSSPVVMLDQIFKAFLFEWTNTVPERVQVLQQSERSWNGNGGQRHATLRSLNTLHSYASAIIFGFTNTLVLMVRSGEKARDLFFDEHHRGEGAQVTPEEFHRILHPIAEVFKPVRKHDTLNLPYVVLLSSELRRLRDLLPQRFRIAVI